MRSTAVVVNVPRCRVGRTSSRSDHRLGADRHRPGLRVRLLGHAGVQGAARGGLRVILVNSNPATIMTDPELADATYVEPLTVEVLDKILEKEKPSAILPTLGGQTGAQPRAGREQGGPAREARRRAARRDRRRRSRRPRIASCSSRRWRGSASRARSRRLVTSVEEARAAIDEIGFPAILRPSFTLGGSRRRHRVQPAPSFDRMVAVRRSSSRRCTRCSSRRACSAGRSSSSRSSATRRTTSSIVCSIENLDPMGVHTGDSITVAPAMTLTDKEYQRLRDAAIAIMREIGVETGGCERAVRGRPEDRPHARHRDEPARVALDRRSRRRRPASRSRRSRRSSRSATRSTSSRTTSRASRRRRFEPTIDYVVVKWPRFAFEKFPGADAVLGPQMKSRRRGDGDRPHVPRGARQGDPLARDRARRLRPADDARSGDDLRAARARDRDRRRPDRAVPGRPRASSSGCTLERAHELTRIDPWFLASHPRDRARRAASSPARRRRSTTRRCARLKRLGLSDRRIARADRRDRGRGPRGAPRRRRAAGLQARRHLRAPSSRRTRRTSTRRTRTSASRAPDRQEEGDHPRRRSEPHRPGHRVRLLLRARRRWRCARRASRSIMVNCNPETVSTDYDTSRPAVLRAAHARGRARDLRRREAVGRDRAVRRADAAQARGARSTQAGVPILGTTRRRDRPRRGPRAVRRAADEARAARAALGHRAQRSTRRARSPSEIGFPVMVRPSYVLGGRAMERVYDARELEDYFARASVEAAQATTSTHVGFPLLVDRVPRRRDRGRRRRASPTRPARRHRRRDGAHRGGRHPLRRLGVRRCRPTRCPPTSSTRSKRRRACSRSSSASSA